MLDDGLLATAADGAEPVSMAFAIHQTPTIPSGMVASQGRVAHGFGRRRSTSPCEAGAATPPCRTTTSDPIPIACEMVGAFQAMVTRRVDVFDPAVVTVASIQAGTTSNVIPETAELYGTVRTVSEKARDAVIADIERVATGIASAHGATAEVEITRGYPVTVNHDDAAAFALETAGRLLGAEHAIEMPTPVMGAEDWSYVLQQVPRRHGVPRHPPARGGRPRRRPQPLQPHGARRGRHGGRHRHLRRRRPQVAGATTVMVPAIGSTST